MTKNLKVYVVYDKIADDTVTVSTATTDGMFVRTYSKGFYQLDKNFLNDFEVYHVGDINMDDYKLIPCDKRLVSWDCYKMPESPVEKQ